MLSATASWHPYLLSCIRYVARWPGTAPCSKTGVPRIPASSVDFPEPTCGQRDTNRPSCSRRNRCKGHQEGTQPDPCSHDMPQPLNPLAVRCGCGTYWTNNCQQLVRLQGEGDVRHAVLHRRRLRKGPIACSPPPPPAHRKNSPPPVLGCRGATPLAWQRRRALLGPLGVRSWQSRGSGWWLLSLLNCRPSEAGMGQLASAATIKRGHCGSCQWLLLFCCALHTVRFSP